MIYIDDDDKRYEGAGVESLYNMMCYIQWPDDDNEDDYQLMVTDLYMVSCIEVCLYECNHHACGSTIHDMIQVLYQSVIIVYLID